MNNPIAAIVNGAKKIFGYDNEQEPAPVKPTLSPEDQALVKRITKIAERGRQQRRPHDDRYAQGYAFRNGDQWKEWRKGKAVDLTDKRRPGKIYSVNNKVRPAVRKHVSRALAQKVELPFRPMTGREIDKRAAMQARSLVANWKRVWDWETQLKRAVEFAVVVGPVFSLPYWDKGAIVPVPVLGPNGLEDIRQIQDAPVGETFCEFIYCTDILPDNDSARSWEEVNAVVVERERPLAWIRTRWPDTGKFIKPQKDETGDENRMRFETLNGDQTRGTDSDSAVVRTLYQLPFGENPGCIAIECQGVILEKKTQWPYPELKGRDGRPCLPLTCLEFEPGIMSLWGDNAVTPLVPLQRMHNRLLTRMERHAQNGDGKLIAPRGCELDTDAYESGEENEIVWFSPHPKLNGARPEPLQMLPLDPIFSQLIPLLDQWFNIEAEVQEVSQGLAPNAQMSGLMYQAMRDADESTGVLFTKEVERFVRETFRKALGVSHGMFVEPRLVMVQDAAVDDPMMVAAEFDAIGQGRYVLESQASTPQTPGALAETILNMGRAGMFAPDQLPATIQLLKLMGIEQSDKLSDDLVAALTQQIQQQTEQKAQDAAAAQEAEAQKAEASRQLTAEQAAVAAQTRGEELASDADAQIRVNAAKAEEDRATAVLLAALAPKPETKKDKG